jgi:tetratricopeptide (TPR) repeat protein
MTKLEVRVWVVVVNLPAAVLICASPVLTLTPASSPAPRTFAQTEQPQVDNYVALPVPYPDLSKMDGAVRQQLRGAQSELISTIQRPGINQVQLSEAYGQLGKLYEVYDLTDAAVACFLNAVGLQPQRFEWNYYLGYSYERQANLNKAVVYYGNALRIQPDSLAPLIRLAEIHLDLNHPDLARPLFQRALALNKSSAAALAGIGKIALYERNYAEAVEKLGAALDLEPQASSLRYPLALAYRGMGDLDRAEASLQKKGTAEATTADPLLDEMQELRKGQAVLWIRGMEALGEDRYAEAAKDFREMVEADPGGALPRMYLGISLARAGERTEAMQQFSKALRSSPDLAGAHYNLGLLLAQQGSEQEAIRHFRAAIKWTPELKDAHFQLANFLMRAAEFRESLAEYTTVIRMDPQNAFARLMQAMALVKLKSYSAAQRQLEAALEVLPGNTDIASALARLLAACPEGAIRNGPRALKLAQRAFEAEGTPDLDRVEALAMALAEAGHYGQAAQLQRSLITEVERSGLNDLARLLRDNLVLYESGKACRTPWRDDDPIFKPVPGSGA